MKAFKGVSSAVPMAHGSSLTEIFNAVNKVFIPRHRKESYVDKKFEETALLIWKICFLFEHIFSKYNASASLNTRGKYSTQVSGE